MRRLTGIVSAAVLLSLLFCFPIARGGGFAPGGGGEARGAVPSPPEYVPGEVLVKFKDGAGGAHGSIYSGLGVVSAEDLPLSNLKRLALGRASVEKALEVLRSSSLVEYAEPNYIRRADWEPNDPLYNSEAYKQWNFQDQATEGGINMPGAWDLERGGDPSVVVAVIDTGVAYRNGGGYRRAPDLEDTNFVHGYDFVNGDRYADDDNGHGTHVCGTVAQSTDQTPPFGCAGIAFGCTVMPVKVLDREGAGTDSDIVKGIEYAANNGAEVINMSLSGPDRSEALEEAVEYAVSKDVVVCASSGNENAPQVGYPAAYDDCIAVGATGPDKKRAPYSNYGSALDVVAPGGDGEGLSSGILQQTYENEGDPSSDFVFKAMSGTSMACPHVAGVAALLRSRRGAWSAGEVRAAITSTCLDLGDTGWDERYGWGLIDAKAALEASRRTLARPEVNLVAPNHASEGDSASLTVEGKNFTGGAKIILERTGENRVVGTDVVLSGDTVATCDVDLSGSRPGLWDVVVETPHGVSGRLAGGFMVDTEDDRTWYLAEGSTAHGFEEFILIQNPNVAAANCEVTLMTPEGAMDPVQVPVPPESRATLTVNDAAPDTDVSARVTSDQDVICERSMYWNNRIEGTDSIGIQSPSYTWYLAEGTTDYGFETYVLIQNPGPRPAFVDVTYMTGDGPVEKPTFKVDGFSRHTINVADDLPSEEMSVAVVADRRVICERSMYWDGRRGGHASIGTNLPSQKWYLAEGSTDWGFDEYVLLQNPSDEAANVTLTYMTPEGPLPQPGRKVNANSRVTVHLNQELPGEDVSVEAVSDRGIVVERAMYWNNGTAKGGHATIGVPQPRQQCYLAEGTTDWGFDEWVLVQNPNDSPANIGIEYMTSSGLMHRDGFALAPRSRVTVHVNGDIPPIDTSTYVFSNKPVIAERSMYWNSNGGGHVSQGLMR
jgi:serine protease